MTINLEVLKEKMFYGMLYLSLVWIFFALSFQLYFVYLQLTNNNERATQVTNEITWRIDGTFKNNPDNIWYEGPKK
jgi:hypothetical protein